MTDDSALREVLQSRRSRAGFLKGAAVAAATLGVAPSAVLAAGSKTGAHAMKMPESTKSILDIAITAEAAAVTAIYHLHEQVDAGRFSTAGIAVPVGTLVAIVRAILREEQDHYSFLMGAGAKPLYTSFTFPRDIFLHAVPALRYLQQLETIFVGAYMAANREFALGGMDKLAQYTYQIGAVEAEHRTLARAGLGQNPPNNKSFESNEFKEVAGAAHVLGEMGIFKPGMKYPGAAAVDHILSSTVTHNKTAGVVQRTP